MSKIITRGMFRMPLSLFGNFFAEIKECNTITYYTVIDIKISFFSTNTIHKRVPVSNREWPDEWMYKVGQSLFIDEDCIMQMVHDFIDDNNLKVDNIHVIELSFIGPQVGSSESNFLTIASVRTPCDANCTLSNHNNRVCYPEFFKLLFNDKLYGTGIIVEDKKQLRVKSWSAKILEKDNKLLSYINTNE